MCGAALEAVGDAIPTHVMSTLRGEERLVTVVFADLTESVRRTSDLSPEEATALVNPLLEAMVELMVRHGGRIDRFLGDGVLAVFGVPEAHEDDPIRAVRAAVELRERAASLGLAITAGVNTGRVYFGPVGSSLHEELTVMGPTVNLAARLQSAAGADQILVGESTRGHVESSFHLERLTLTIKGIAKPVAAYSAEYLVDHPDKVRGLRELRAELVGRDDAVELLVNALGEVRGSFALIGPAGVGKSRLAAELNRHAAEEGTAWLEGRCLELTRHLPFGPFVDLFRRCFGTKATARTLIGSLDDLVSAGALDPERVDEMKPFLTALLGEELGDERDLRVRESSPDNRRRLTIQALVDYLVHTARRQPTVVFIDDMHWADDASIEAVDEIRRAAKEVSLMLVLAFRPDADGFSPDLASLEELATIRLTELTPQESRVLISRLLEIDGIPPALEETIVANAGGNPFYVEEILRTLIQRGALVQQAGKWVATSSLGEVTVPESVEGLLMSRFDRLGPGVKHTARLASVLDGEFDDELIAALAGPEAGAELPGLVEAGLTAVQRAGPTPHYAFLHALTRQAIYSSLLPSQRTELHGKVAATLERLQPEDLDRLAHHYQHSAEDEKAVEYSLAAAEQAMASYANDIASLHLENGLERIPHLAEEGQRRWRASYRTRRGQLLERQAEHTLARSELLAALADLADAPREEANIWRLIGQTHRLEGGFDEAHHSYDKAELALDRTLDRGSVAAHRAWIEIQQERSHALYFGGRGRELPDHNASVAPIVQKYGTVAQQVDLARAVAMDEFIRNRFALDSGTVDRVRPTLELARTGADPGRIAETTFVLGFTLLWADEVEEAAEVLDRAIREATRVGDMIHENRARSYHAIALRRSGRVDEAEEAALASLELTTALDDSYYQGHAQATLSWVGWRRADGTCRTRAEGAYDAWGPEGGTAGFSTEFVWMASLPLAAEAHRDGDGAEAVSQLRHLLVPWERPLPAELRQAVDQAMSDPTALPGVFELAVHHRLL
jgi:class 3 adenylate cyclase/tetratricopeptide (TPR) repeat protein